MRLLIFGLLVFSLEALSSFFTNRTRTVYRPEVRKFERDSILNAKIAYDSVQSIKNTFGSSFGKKLRLDFEADYPSVYYTTKTRKEYLRCMVFPGNACCQFFEVGYLSDINNVSRKKYPSSFDYFYTNNHIRLGIALKDFFQLIPERLLTKKTVDEYDVYELKQGVYNEESFPGLSAYLARYKFRKGILIAFGFGRNFPNFNPLIDN
ncbi:MAG: hypothetical protein J7599_22535 [Niabella sp.]|nr:hypothetical protein [Niabella sp.]